MRHHPPPPPLQGDHCRSRKRRRGGEGKRRRGIANTKQSQVSFQHLRLHSSSRYLSHLSLYHVGTLEGVITVHFVQYQSMCELIHHIQRYKSSPNRFFRWAKWRTNGAKQGRGAQDVQMPPNHYRHKKGSPLSSRFDWTMQKANGVSVFLLSASPLTRFGQDSGPQRSYEAASPLFSSSLHEKPCRPAKVIRSCQAFFSSRRSDVGRFRLFGTCLRAAKTGGHFDRRSMREAI